MGAVSVSVSALDPLPRSFSLGRRPIYAAGLSPGRWAYCPLEKYPKEGQGKGKGRLREPVARGQRLSYHLFRFSLNSSYGRASLLRDRQSNVRSGKSLATAMVNKSEWLSRVRKTDVVGVKLTGSGPEVTFVTESDSKRLCFTNLQSAVQILDNSKMQLVRMQYLLSQLYDKENMTICYGDTDSTYAAFRYPSLEDNERKSLEEEERKRLRFELYGSAEEGRNFGKCKIETSGESMVVIGLKCYFIIDRDQSGNEEVKCRKFKGSSAADKMSLERLREISRHETLSKERTVRMKRSSFGVRRCRNGAARATTGLILFLSDLARVHGEAAGRLPHNRRQETFSRGRPLPPLRLDGLRPRRAAARKPGGSSQIGGASAAGGRGDGRRQTQAHAAGARLLVSQGDRQSHPVSSRDGLR